jgi:16S rRNA (cytosine967-C5)-methyltransferase
MSNILKNVRKYSFDILKSVFCDDNLLNDAINRNFNDNDLTDENKAFIKRECTGVIENIEEIDNIINKYSKLKTNKLKKDILIVFRLSTYEILYMDKVPTYATINEAVNIIKNTKYKSLSGYVNATLKSIANNKTRNNVINKNYFKHCYFKIVNDDVNNTIDKLKDLKIEFYEYDGSLIFKHSNIFYTKKYKEILNTDLFKNGFIIIQDASSAYLIDKLYELITNNFKDNFNELNVLDTCAAPGGKIISLYYLLNKTYNNFFIEARDISNNKINKIKENIDRLKINNIKLNVSDATIYNQNDYQKYDIILCDVPCSGTGVINKKPDIKLRTNKEKIKTLQSLQYKILDISKEYLKQGGLLSYSTCTETIEENEDNISTFLNKNKNFEKIFEKRINANDENKADGFYMCIMKKL